MIKKPDVAVIAAGEMGSAIGRQLVLSGFHVCTLAEGRSRDTRERIEESGMTVAPTCGELVERADLLISVVPSHAADAVAARILEECPRDGSDRIFLEANAIAPQKSRDIARSFEGSNMAFVDGGIVGLPPSDGRRPTLYTSGPSQGLSALDDVAWRRVDLGAEIGRASALKMLYASVTKGVNTLLTNATLAAGRLGLLEEFLDELHTSQGQLEQRARANVPRLPADAGRWAAEMQEIAATFREAGLPDDFHRGAEAIMRILDASRFGDETRRSRDTRRTLEETVRAIVDDLGT